MGVLLPQQTQVSSGGGVTVVKSPSADSPGRCQLSSRSQDFSVFEVYSGRVAGLPILGSPVQKDMSGEENRSGPWKDLEGLCRICRFPCGLGKPLEDFKQAKDVPQFVLVSLTLRRYAYFRWSRDFVWKPGFMWRIKSEGESGLDEESLSKHV